MAQTCKNYVKGLKTLAMKWSFVYFLIDYLSIIPRARMGSESIAHESERNNCFSKIQLVGQKYRDKKTLAS